MGGTALRFTPLYGVHGGGPLSYLLEVGNFIVLLDCGWDDRYDPKMLRPLLDILDHIDLVLLSHPDPAHLGALPFLVGRQGLSAPIYATGPVHRMGQMFMYDQYLCRQATSDFDVFNLDDVDAAFAPARFTTLRYQQNVQLKGKGSGITVTPFAAGHLLGGTLWRITKDDEDVVYAVDYNHRKERHLNGTTLESAFCRPSLLITDAWNAEQRAPTPPSRDKEFLGAVLSTLRGDGSVLIPIDAAGRLLELILLLERHWGELRLTYPLVLVSPMASNVLEFAKSQLEWMTEGLTKSLGHTRDNPFNTRYLKLVGSREELSRLPHGPKVVLSTLPSLEAGPSRQIFADWAGDPRNAVVMVLQPEEHTLAQRVLDLADQRGGEQGGAQRAQRPPPSLQLTLSRRVPLEGEELQAHLEAQQAEQEQSMPSGQGEGLGGSPEGGSPRAHVATRFHSHSIALLSRESGRGGGEGPMGAAGPMRSASAMSAGSDGPSGAAAAHSAHSTADTCLIEGFKIPAGAAGPMFPYQNAWEGVQYDEYGAAIDHADFDLREQDAGIQAMETELAGEADVAAAAAPPDIPTKVVSEEVTVSLAARVLRFDFDGRSDGRSMRTMLVHVAPRRCILVHGTTQATQGLQSYLQQELASLQVEVHAPREGEAVEVVAEPSYRVALSQQLLAGLTFHPMGSYQLAWVNGRVAPAAGGQRSDDEEAQTAVGQLLPALGPAAGDDGARGPEGSVEGEEESVFGGVFIGDIRLSELRKALAGVGIASEFHGGTLYCAGGVAVRRQGEEGGLLVEGPLSEDYYQIRDVVYAQYHVC